MKLFYIVPNIVFLYYYAVLRGRVLYTPTIYHNKIVHLIDSHWMVIVLFFSYIILTRKKNQMKKKSFGIYTKRINVII